MFALPSHLSRRGLPALLAALALLCALPLLAATPRGAPGLRMAPYGVISVQGQGRPYRPVGVRSCPYADSLLGPLGDDVRGAVRGFYHEERDTSYFVTGVGGVKPPDITSSAKLAGRGPDRDPAIQLTAFLRDRDARTLAEASRNGPVQVTFVLDDSVTVYPASTALGRLEGDAKVMTLPASARLAGDELRKVARARRILMKAGPAAVLFSDERRELRALIRVAVCPQ